MFKDHLDGSKIVISEIYSVFSESLLNSFAIYHKNLTKRVNETHTSSIRNWLNQDPNGIHQWMVDIYSSFVAQWSWNESYKVKIIPQHHGTSFAKPKRYVRQDLQILFGVIFYQEYDVLGKRLIQEKNDI